MTQRAHGFQAPPQVNPSGYGGTGRGLAPHPSIRAASVSGGDPENAVATAPDRTEPATNTVPAVFPPFATTAQELGVGVSRIRELGVLGARL